MAENEFILVIDHIVFVTVNIPDIARRNLDAGWRMSVQDLVELLELPIAAITDICIVWQSLAKDHFHFICTCTLFFTFKIDHFIF